MTDTHGPGSGVDLDRLTAELDARLDQADAALERGFPGERPGRQPVHTVYVPADRFHSGTFQEYGEWALWSMDDHETLFLDLLEGDLDLLDTVRQKLNVEPVEDLRIDFEDGYTVDDDEQEDADVERAAQALRQAIKFGDASAFHGIRFKSFERATRERGLRTLTPVRRDAGRRRCAAGRLRRHAAQGDLGGPGRGHGARGSERSSRASASPIARSASRSRSRPRSRSSAPTAPRSWPA